MMELLWLLLPVAAASGWWMARREPVIQQKIRSPGRTADSKGLNYRLDDKPDETIEALIKLVEVDRDTADTHLALGTLFRRRGEVDRAISLHSQLLARATLSAQQRSRAVLELGEDYMRAGLFDRAEALFRELSKQPHHTTVALARLVGIYEQEKDWRQAIDHCDRLEQMTRQSRKVETAHFCCELAEQFWHQNNADEAREFLRQALVRDPNSVRASILRGRMAMAEGNFASAITAFQAVEHQNRSFFPEVINPLWECYTALQRQTEWVEYLRDVHGRDHSGRVTDALAGLLLQCEGEEVALTFLEPELRSYPTLIGLRRLVELKLARSESANPDLEALYRIGKYMLNDLARYECDKCGFVGKSLHWCCPSCKSWSSVKPLPDLVFKSKA